MADSSSKIVKAIFSSSKGGGNKSNFDIGKIDPRILKILGLEEEFDLDYETYFSSLKEKMLLISMGKSKLSREDEELIIEEFKRLKSKKFPKKKITADSFKKGTAVGINLNVKKITGGVTPKQLMLPPAVDKMSGKSDIQEIIDALSSIIEQLTMFNKLSGDEQERNRRGRENRRRREREGELEKSFDGVMKAAEKVITPVKSILDRIINFLVMTLIGRSLILLLEWFSDKDNQDKVRAISRFLGDHWPKLLALFITFGTGLGGFVRSLIGVVIKGTGALIKGATRLAARAGIKGAAGALKFLGGPKGRLIGAVAEVGAVALGTVALSKGIENFGGIGGEEPKEEKVQFSGGGFANFKNLFSNIGGFFSGLVRGPGGPKGDKIPAMLSNGEFVVSAGAVQKYGVDTFEAMNAAGGGTNIPKIASGIVRAAGGGYIGNPVVAQEAWTNYMKMNPSKFAKGADYGDFESVNRASRDFMKTFMKTGKPPEWAKVTQKTTKVNTPPRSSQTSPPRSSQTSPPRSTPPNTSSSSLMRRPTSALSTDVRSPGIRSVRPRGYGGALQAAFAAMEFNDRKQAGQTTAQAGLGAAGSALGGQVGWMAGAKSGALLGGAIGAMFGGVGAGPGAAVGAIVGGIAGGFGGASLGGKLADDVSGVNAAKERMSRGGIGGAIKGGFGLKKESAKDQFKNAPKTTIMVDERNGRPFVAHKAMKDGKLTYVRPPKPGTGTTNPLEALGRMINPNAYKDSDARLAMKNQKIAMVNALENMQRQGMAPDAQERMMKRMGGNLKDTQNDLNYRKKTQAKLAPTKPKTAGSGVTPPAKPKVNVKYTAPAGGGMNGRRGSGSSPSTATPKVPQFSSSSQSRTRKRTASTYGIG